MDLKLDRAPVGELKDWTLYPATLAMRLRAARDTSLVGGQMIFESDLPMAAGMSSSSVLLVSTFLALARCNDLDQDSGWQRQIPDRQVLAEFLGAVEGGRRFQILAGDQGVGTRGGDQDHTAILCSAPGSVRQYRYLPTMLEGTIPMPADWVLALAVSGVRAAKKKGAGTHYNRAAEAVRRLEQCWETDLGEAPATLGQIVGSDPQAAERLFECVGSTVSEPRLRSRLQDRLRHFLAEAEEIVPAAGEALAAGDLELLGHWSDRSMTLATELLGNQVPETIWLAAAARERGAPAASAFGAGFGGAVWALVPSGDIDRFLQGWRSDYLRRFPQHRATARFDWTRAGMGAGEF